MQIFDPVARGNAADTADGCQMMSYTNVEKDLNRSEQLNFKFSFKSLINCCFYQNIT